jgi:hypothetical protein
MAGFKPAAPSVPLDYCHNDSEIVGVLDEFKPTDDGLDCSGRIVPFTEHDRASEVDYKSRQGVPYQASIYFDPDNLVIEQLGQGAKTKVNGYELEGPAIIFREWMLRGVAVCPYGYDVNTSTRLSAGTLAGEITLPVTLSNIDPMKKTPAQLAADAANKVNKLEATEGDETEKKDEELSTETEGDETEKKDEEEELSAPRAEFAATLKRFAEKFGATNGAAWAAEGLSYEQALERHVAELTAGNQKLAKEKTDLAAKLSAVNRGEKEPVTFATDEKHEGGKKVPAQFAGLGKLGAFAANIKLPNAAKK